MSLWNKKAGVTTISQHLSHFKSVLDILVSDCSIKRPLYYLELHSDYQNHLRCRGGGLVQVQILKVFCLFFLSVFYLSILPSEEMSAENVPATNILIRSARYGRSSGWITSVGDLFYIICYLLRGLINNVGRE